jgi:hypothetical protein
VGAAVNICDEIGHLFSKTHNEAYRVVPSRDSLGSPALKSSPLRYPDFVETVVEIVEKHTERNFYPQFTAGWRMSALAKKNCDCTNHGR